MEKANEDIAGFEERTNLSVCNIRTPNNEQCNRN
jgi:hypothetical protein